MLDSQLELGLIQPADNPIDRLQRELRFVAETVTAIMDSLPIQRRPLNDSTKAVHVKATWLRRNGFCPACQQTPVCVATEKVDGAEFDHWYARHRNRAEETWLVCAPCNSRLESTAFKASIRSAFESYQAALRPFLDGGQVTLFQ